MFRRHLSVFILSASIACGGEPTAPDDSALIESGNQSNLPLLIRLSKPSHNSLVSQNDSTIGCSQNATRGYGFQIKFSWILSSNAGTAGYGLYVKHRDSQFAWLDSLVDTDTHTETSCNGFVADHNVENWEWRVRALDASGAWGPWSDTGVFHFEACRHADGRHCTAPG